LKETEFIWLREGKTDRLLRTQKEYFNFHIMTGISRQAEEITSFQEGLSSMEFLKSVADFSNIRARELG